MALKLVTPPATEPLTVATAKEHCRIWDSNEDAYVSGLITSARIWCEKRLRRSLLTTTWRQTFGGLPACGVLELDRAPLVGVTGFQYVTEAGATDDVSESLYSVDTDSEPGRIVRGYGLSWPTVRTSGAAAPVTVTYTAGYGDADDVPETIKQAMLLLIGHWYENRESIVIGKTATYVPQAVESLLAAESWGAYP